MEYYPRATFSNRRLVKAAPAAGPHHDDPEYNIISNNTGDSRSSGRKVLAVLSEVKNSADPRPSGRKVFTPPSPRKPLSVVGAGADLPAPTPTSAELLESARMKNSRRFQGSGNILTPGQLPAQPVRQGRAGVAGTGSGCNVITGAGVPESRTRTKQLFHTTGSSSAPWATDC
eukprot:RCo030955